MGPSRILIFFEKRSDFGSESGMLLRELQEASFLKGVTGLRVWTGYAIEPAFTDIAGDVFPRAAAVLGDPVTSPPPLDYEGLQREIRCSSDHGGTGTYRITGDDETESESWSLAVMLQPAQFDQRGDSARQLLELSGCRVRDVRSISYYLFQGNLEERDRQELRKRLINPVDSREPDLAQLSSIPDDIVEGFTAFSAREMDSFRKREAPGLDLEDLLFIREWYGTRIGRDPGRVELAILATYWSDHCRHTTFNTRFSSLTAAESPCLAGLDETLAWYRRDLEFRGGEHHASLMDMALAGARVLAREGLLPDLDRSEEINAASVEVEARYADSRPPEPWLLMFKNETHNHPTEIEPFGGASTCIGGAIRDPLSGRAFVHQGMRLSGAPLPSREAEEAEGELLRRAKLPRSVVARESARGFSSYGNQIGLATGFVREVYDEGFRAKRFEAGAVIGGVPKEMVRREGPVDGDLVLLLGGETGRDGIGGATGSSRSHDEHSVERSGAEVQKGNAPQERALQRLFRRREATRLIKRCNDFGAGGVAVAVGELAPGLLIDLDAVPLKYRGLSAREIILSESQERMAVVVDASAAEELLALAAEEDVQGAIIARISDSPYLEIFHQGSLVASLPRELLDSAGAPRNTRAVIAAPGEENYFRTIIAKRRRPESGQGETGQRWKALLQEVNVSGGEGLTEMFDSTVGGRSVLLPLGGRFQFSPEDGMAALLPGDSDAMETASVMSCGYSPEISRWSPYHGAIFSVVEACTRAVSTGLPLEHLRLSLQEYFPPPGDDPEKWGAPAAALLGALRAQLALQVPAIGGKDSMSGKWMDLEVPPVLAAFAAGVADADRITPSCFTAPGSELYLLYTPIGENLEPDFSVLKENCAFLSRLQGAGSGGGALAGASAGAGAPSVLGSCKALGYGGLAQALAEASFGNGLGFSGTAATGKGEIDPYMPLYGSFILEWRGSEPPDPREWLLPLGRLNETGMLELLPGERISIQDALSAWRTPRGELYPGPGEILGESSGLSLQGAHHRPGQFKASRRGNPAPRVTLFTFRGTNCEEETARAFEREGGICRTLLFRERCGGGIEESLSTFAEALKETNILVLPGGFSAGDEPDGSAKYIAAVLSSPILSDAIGDFLDQRDGLILGICNGFQALVRSGLLPDGRIHPRQEGDPVLAHNSIGRHISRYVTTRVESSMGPWMTLSKPGELHNVPVSHGEGRFYAPAHLLDQLESSGQVAFRYTTGEGEIAEHYPDNPNGSLRGIEGLLSPDGRILGKMGHSERWGRHLAKNIPAPGLQAIFAAGIAHFR